MIYDCFPFFNELDIIEIRFKELYDHVDRFVLCESNVTHAGNPKPLHYMENKERYARFSDKIIHVVCDDPTEPERGHDMNWTRERNQRNFIYHTLNRLCRGNDIIITTDADEIFSSKSINQLATVESSKLYALEMRSSWYSLNCVCEPRWSQGRLARFATIKNKFGGSLSAVRAAGTEGCIFDCGWHFSYMGGHDRVKQKLQSFAHQEFNTPDKINDSHIQHVMRFGSSIWDEFQEISPRGNIPYWNYVSLPYENFPACVNRGEYNHLVSEVYFSKLDYDCGNLYHLFNLAKNITGEGCVLDIGCAEGRTSIYLANALPNDQVVCIDLKINEQFGKNMLALTDGNMLGIEGDALAILQSLDQPIKVLHIDVDNPELTSQIIGMALPRLTESHLICGYDRSKNFPQNIQAETSQNFWFST